MKSGWKYAFAIICIAVISFLVLKSVLPRHIFPTDVQKSENGQHIAVDEFMQEAKEGGVTRDSTLGLARQDSSDLSGRDTLQNKEIHEDQFANMPIDSTFFDGAGLKGTADNELLHHFYEALWQLQRHPNSQKVRIAYFGDSMTDADLIVEDIRKAFQKQFGGYGVGFVPITSESARGRYSIIHRFSDNWLEYSFMRKSSRGFPLGVTGKVYYVKDSVNPTYVKYKGGSFYSTTLPHPTLYYGQSQNKQGAVKRIIDGDTTLINLKPEALVNRLVLNKGRLKSIKLVFENADSIPFFGVDFSSSIGIHVDNFSDRGNSGLPLSMLNSKIMHSFQKDLHYDLIILGYGTNVMSHNSLDYGWYGISMSRVINHVRQAFPGASVLLVSIADRSAKYDTEMKTDSAVAPLLKTQEKIARKKKTGFINLFKLMGGEGSMVKWVEDEPSRANKDYTHFNSNGAREIGRLIYKHIFEGYQNFKKQKEAVQLKKRVEDSLRKSEEKPDSLPPSSDGKVREKDEKL